MSEGRTWDDDVIAFDPFAGDFGGGGPSDKVLADKIVTARKARPCFHCAEPIAPGTRIRVRKEVYDGDLESFAWCRSCCDAMANQDDDTLEARSVGAALR